MRLISTVLTTIILLSMCSCKGDKSTNAVTGIVQNGELHIRKKRDPQKLNPFIYPSPSARDVYQYIFPQMADFDPETLQLVPVLIKSIPEKVEITEGPYSGGVKFDIELLAEVVWDNGSPVTGHDVLFSIKMVKHPLVKAAGYRSHLQYISDVIIDDDNPKKFSVIFSEDYMLAKETAITLEIYPRHIYDADGILTDLDLATVSDKDKMESLTQDSTMSRWLEDINGVKYGREIVESCGPYRLKKWVTNEYLVLERKDNYWAADSDILVLQAVPKTMIFDILPDETTAITQLREGNIDVIPNVSGPAFANLQETMPELNFHTPELIKYYLIALNGDQQELSDKKVRKAIAHLVDVDNIIDVIEYGNGTRTVGPIHMRKNYYHNQLEPIPYDIDTAKKILADQGWSDSDSDGTIDKMINGEHVELELDMYVSEGKLGQQIALLLQEAGSKANIKINIIQKPFSEIEKQHLNTRDYDMTPMVVRQDLVLDDPYSRWHSDQDKVGGRNIYGLQNEQLDQITEQIQVTNDPAVRNRLYRQVQEILYDEQPVIFLYSPRERIVVSSEWNSSSTVRRPGYLANTFTQKSKS